MAECCPTIPQADGPVLGRRLPASPQPQLLVRGPSLEFKGHHCWHGCCQVWRDDMTRFEEEAQVPAVPQEPGDKGLGDSRGP